MSNLNEFNLNFKAYTSSIEGLKVRRQNFRDCYVNNSLVFFHSNAAKSQIENQYLERALCMANSGDTIFLKDFDPTYFKYLRRISFSTPTIEVVRNSSKPLSSLI